MPTPQNVASEFNDQLISDMKRGYHGQHDKLNVLETKSMYFSLSIQQMIHEIVKNSSPLLMNISSEPFLENSCCLEPTDRRSIRTIDYFMSKAQNIHHHNRIIGFLEKMSLEMTARTTASILMDNRNTRFNYPEIPAAFNEETIYRAFIAYCKLNHASSRVRSNPVSTALNLIPEIRDMCIDPPDDWNPTDPIDQKIHKLKKVSNLYDTDSLDRLLRAINAHNIIDNKYVNSTRSREPMRFQRFRDAILHLNRIYENADHEEETQLANMAKDVDADMPFGIGSENAGSILDRCIIPLKLRKLLIANMDTNESTVIEDTEEMRDIKNYLHTKNTEMREHILSFIQQNGKQTKAKIRDIEKIVKTIMKFEINQSNGVLMSSLDETATKSIQFMKNSIKRLSEIIPSIILRGIDFDNTNMSSHWGFSDMHMKDIKTIISSHYTSLKTFYNDYTVKEVIRHANQHI